MRETGKPVLHLCDFDGTLTRGDTLWRFVAFALPARKLAASAPKLALRWFFLLFSGKWTNEKAKKALFDACFRGMARAELEKAGADFCQKRLPGLLRRDLLRQLREARRKGDTVVVVSASSDWWLRPFCLAEGFGLLCTEWAFSEDGRFEGKLAAPNCNGAEKARRIKAAYHLTGYSKVVAYGNSGGDREMCALADECAWF